MKKTVIISPYGKGISGTAEYFFSDSGNTINLTVNHPRYGQSDLLRLYAMSTSRAGMTPYMAGYFEAEGSSSVISAQIDTAKLADAGFELSDIDTYLLTKYDGENEEPVAAAFFGLEWNAARFLNRAAINSPCCEMPVSQFDNGADGGEHESDRALTNAENALIKLKSGKNAGKDKINKYISDFKKSLDRFERFYEFKDSGYEWYKITCASPITNLSAVRHILSNRFASASVNKAGFYIAGMNSSDNRHIAIGIPAGRHVCPMPQLADCCGYEEGYHIAGIFLGDDGQYFEKYLKNVE